MVLGSFISVCLCVVGCQTRMVIGSVMVLGSFRIQTYASNNLELKECKCSVFLRTGKRLNTIVYKGWLGSKHKG